MFGLPTGTVTFLFTDVEGSTRLLGRLGSDRYAATLALHHRLLRAAFAAHGGVEITNQGDGFFAAFRSAGDGVAAAAAVQRNLAAQEWAEGEEVRVRIGVHTGEPLVSGEDYVGIDVHRAARISASAHGGQVVLSQTTADLLGERLPPGVSVRTLGERRLKDLTRPQRLYQLLIEGLPTEFPPLMTLELRRTNLPAQPTPLVGREGELREIGRLLDRDETRLLTLTGAGGTGKTRLGLQAAAEAIDRFPDGVYVVFLASVAEPGAVPQAIADALGVAESGSSRLDDLLADHLSQRQLLVVLDNFEHLLGAASRVAELLESAAGLRLLVTSRAPLRVRAEREFAVQPLGLPDPRRPSTPDSLLRCDATSLFVERARAVDRDFVVTSESAEAIASICARLDGLPLAIELAAARVRILPPPALAERLDHRLTLLTSGALDLPERQQTLRGTIDWSYRLLAEGQRRLFDRLAVFPGGCTLAAAKTVCDPDSALGIDVLDGISSLVENSLLRQEHEREGEPRFSMLETVREFAQARLDESDEDAAVRRRHADYFLTVAERAGRELRGPQASSWLDRIGADHENLRAALGWAGETGNVELQLRMGAALWIYWLARGHLTEGRRWLAVALESGHAQPPGARADALVASAALMLNQGEREATRAAAEESLALYEELGNSAGIARSLTLLGHVADNAGNSDRGRELHELSVVAARQGGDRWDLAVALNNLGERLLNIGDPAAAIDIWQEALPVSRELGNAGVTGRILDGLGFAAIAEGRRDAAESWLREALEVFVDIEDRLCIGGVLMGMSAVAAVSADAPRAARLLGAADALHDEVEDELMPDEFRTRLLERTLAAIRAALGETAAADALAEGRAMSLEQAVDEARATTTG